MPSTLHQQIPVAVVTVRTTVSPDELLAFARARLGTRGPAQIIVAPELPKNAMGKVLKNELARALVRSKEERADG